MKADLRRMEGWSWEGENTEIIGKRDRERRREGEGERGDTEIIRER